MNGQEQATLENFDKKLSDHIDVSNKRWNKIEPMVKAYHDQKIIDKFVEKFSSSLVSLLKLIALIIGIVASVWLFFRN